MIREEIKSKIFQILEKEFEIKNPDADDNLRDEYGFDSIDAITLLGEIEKKILNSALSQEEKKQAMDIRTINDICDYVESLQKIRV